MEPLTKRPRHATEISFPPSLVAWNNSKTDLSLYPTLLLHLGYVSADCDDELLLVLCHHWRQLASQAIFDEEMEIELATTLLNKEILDELVVESILHVVHILATKSFPHELAKALIRHVDKHKSVTKLLHQLASTTTTGKSFYTAACLVWNKDTDDATDEVMYTLGLNIRQGIEPSPTNLDASVTIDFLWALSHSKPYAECLAKMNVVLDYLLRMRQPHTLAVIAKQCPTMLIACRLETMFLNQGLDAVSRDQALSGLYPCSDMLQPSKVFLDAIVDASLDQSERAIVASNLLCQLFDLGKVPSIPLACLLETNNVKVWTRVVESVAKHPTCLKENPILLHSIARLAARDTTSQTVLLQALHLFAIVAQEESHWINMARNQKLVATLVKGTPHPVAMEIMWKLSTPVSNRRILATHTGLLSSWVRYLRTMSPDEPRREEWKDRLVNLANLL